MATYIFPTMAGVSALNGTGDPDLAFDMWGTGAGDVGYATVADHFWGPAFGIFFGIVAVIAQGSIYNTYIASGSRGFFALSEDNLSPKFFIKVDKKYGVPYVTVISIAVVNLALCMFDFSVLIVVDVFLLVASYIMVYISAMVLRKRIPKEEYKFRVPVGDKFFKVICIVPMVVAVISFLINGSDYFIGGMVGIISGPVLYFVWKRYYGGLSKKDAEGHPINKKTGLALGDMKRVSIMFGLLAVIGLLGCLFLPWYEADWVYMNMGEFNAFFDMYGYEPYVDYDLILFKSQEAIWTLIRGITIACAGLCVIFALVNRAIEPKKAA
jgi:amino acid transporter